MVINFLPVGHTHENVDQMFSRVNSTLKRKNVEVPEKFLEALKVSNPNVIEVQEIHEVYHFKHYLLTDDVGEKICGISGPLQWNFRRATPGSTELTDIRV